MEDNEFYWDWLKHEDEIISNRNNLFMVAEAMFFTAFATLATNSAAIVLCSLKIIIWLGIVVTGFWIIANMKHVKATDPLIKEKLHQHEPRRKDIDDLRKRWPSNNLLIGIILPLFILVFWAILLRIWS